MQFVLSFKAPALLPLFKRMSDLQSECGTVELGTGKRIAVLVTVSATSLSASPT